ncbi:tetratricopeptide repeat protein, partial [Calditerricola satsumensis]|uniref:tetratricopeptide repeat protein n=1 Tax=Calditerricola satsumensis TaxID=373054 RepID=UPI0012ED6CBE
MIRLFLACTLLYTGAWAEAAERFAELLRAPDAKIRAVSWNGLGCLAGMRGQYREARDCFRNALRCQDTPVVRYNLAVALLHSHSPAEAISLLEPLVREDPRDWDAALLLLRAYLRAGKRESAERLGSQLLAGQSPPAVLKQVAACLEANGLYGEAAD